MRKGLVVFSFFFKKNYFNQLTVIAMKMVIINASGDGYDILIELLY